MIGTISSWKVNKYWNYVRETGIQCVVGFAYVTYYVTCHNNKIEHESIFFWKSNDKIQCSSSYNYCDVFSSAVAEPGRVESMAWDTIFTENGIHMCLSPLTLWVQILHMVRCSRFNNYVIKFVSDCGFLRVLWFPHPIKLTAMI